MSNDYYASPTDLAPGTKARAGDINTIDQSVDAAFNKLPSEQALKTGTVNYAVNKSATPNAYAVDLAAAVQAYSDGLEVKMRPGTDNTGACTLNVNGLGAIAIKRQDGTDAQAGDLVGASPLVLIYSSTSNTFRLPPLANAQVTAAAASATAAAQSAGAASNSAGTASGYAGAALQARNDANSAAYNAGQSAGAAALSAGAASTSAGQASGSAQSAAQSASNLAAAVTSASQSAGNASTSAGAAAGSATAADTSAKASAASAKASSDSAAASAGSATASATSAGQAVISAQQAAGSATAAATTASQLQTAVATSASSAQSSAQQAGVARDAAIAAWQASTAPTEQLAAISQQVHKGSVIDVFLYDTSKDSDGGAWRKRCKWTSWENETLAGKWLGNQANLAAAQAAGGVNGDYYQSAVDGRFYGINTGEQFRGNTREFPALALIVAETGRVVIYDATQPTMPMWMVIKSLVPWGNASLTGNTVRCVTAVNGVLYVGADGLCALRFPQDNAYTWTGSSGFGGFDAAPLANRHAAGHTYLNGAAGGTLPYLSSSTVYDVATHVRPDAPTDPDSGLPIATVAVATAGGFTVLKHDGNMQRGTVTNGSWQARVVSFDRLGNVWGSSADRLYGGLQLMSKVPYSSVAILGQGLEGFPQIGAYAYGWGENTNWPYLLGGDSDATTLVGDAVPCERGITRVKFNPASPVKSMVAYITNAYNSGWMVGDIRGAYLADTVAETIQDGAEKVINGDFATDISGWTNTLAGSASWVNGAMRRTASAGNGCYQDIPVTPGSTYLIKGKVSLVSGTAGTYAIFVYHGASFGTIAGNISTPGGSTIVTATTTVLRVYLYNDGDRVADFDNISVKKLIVTNGDFAAGTTGWTGNAAGLSIVNGMLRVTCDGSSSYGSASQEIATVPGRSYIFTVRVGAITNNTAFNVIARSGGTNLSIVTALPNLTYTLYFTATATNSTLLFEAINDVDTIFDIDDVTVVAADYDRSFRVKPPAIKGVLTKSPVAAGAQLVAYSGFSASNYLEQPYNPELEFGTGDYCIMGWAKSNSAGASTQSLFNLIGSTNKGIRIGRVTSGGDTAAMAAYIVIYGTLASIQLIGGASSGNQPAWPLMGVGIWTHLAVFRLAGTTYVYVNGILVYSTTLDVGSVSTGDGKLTLGSGFDVTTNEMSMALWRASATAPSTDQLAQIYREELALFQPGAACLVDGGGASIVSASYDDSTGLLHASTNYGYRSTFRGLRRVESDWPAGVGTGALLRVSAAGGGVAVAAENTARFYQPSLRLRDELKRKDEARTALGLVPVPTWFTGAGATGPFTLPLGLDILAVYRQGLLMREGSSNDYTASFDGYRWTVTFSAAVQNNHNICIMGVRYVAN
jgi:hypothetical protein